MLKLNKFLSPKTPVTVPPAKKEFQDAPSSTGTATIADTAPTSTNSDHLTSVLNSLRDLLTPHDPEIQDSRVSGMRVRTSVLSRTDEMRLLVSIFPSLDGRIWERNLERAIGRDETVLQQIEEAIQFYFDNYVGYS